MFTSIAAVGARIEWLESVIYGSSIDSAPDAGVAAAAVPRKFEKPLAARLAEAQAVLEHRLPLDAKLNFKKCDVALSEPESIAPGELPTPSQQALLLSCDDAVDQIGKQLQLTHDLSEVTLNSKHISGDSVLLMLVYG